MDTNLTLAMVNGDLEELLTSADLSLLQLKTQVEANVGIPVKSQKLILGDVELLDDDALLSDLGVATGSVVTVVYAKSPTVLSTESQRCNSALWGLMFGIVAKTPVSIISIATAGFQSDSPVLLYYCEKEWRSSKEIPSNWTVIGRGCLQRNTMNEILLDEPLFIPGDNHEIGLYIHCDKTDGAIYAKPKATPDTSDENISIVLGNGTNAREPFTAIRECDSFRVFVGSVTYI